MSNQRTYTGLSGQLVVMAELLFRQCNTARPERDAGTDLFAFRDESDLLARIQVKTAQGEPYKRGQGYSAVFHIPLAQLLHADRPPLWYVLAARLEDHFQDYVILSRVTLRGFYDDEEQFGTKDYGDLVIRCQFRERLICGSVDLTEYRNAWLLLPPFQEQLVAVSNDDPDE